MSDSIQELYELGQAEGKVEEKLANIKTLMESVAWTAQQAMDALKIPAEEQPQYLAML